MQKEIHSKLCRLFCGFLGAGILGGIGFTMSLFIASLAFADGQELMIAKTAIVLASLASGSRNATFKKNSILG